MKLQIILLFFFLSHSGKGQSLSFTVYNRTGFDIDSVSLCSGYLFSIKAGEQMTIETCKSVFMQSGFPFAEPKGVIHGRKKGKGHIAWCGTGVTEVTEGRYQCAIEMQEDESGYWLVWAALR